MKKRSGPGLVNRQIMEARNEALAPAQPTLGFASKAEPLPGNRSSYVSVLNGAGIVGMKLNPAQWLNAVTNSGCSLHRKTLPDGTLSQTSPGS